MEKVNLGSSLSFFLFISFAAGLIFGNFFPFFWILFVAAFLSAVGVYIFYRAGKIFLSDISILLLFVFLGALWQVAASARSPERFLDKESEVVVQIKSFPQSTPFRHTSSGQITQINSLPFRWKVKTADYTRSMDYLNTYRVKARLTRRIYYGRSVYFLWVKSGAQPVRLPPKIWEKAAQNTAGYILGVFRRNCRPEAVRFLGSVFLGQREFLGEWKDYFAASGVAHLLAISGLHLGLTALILFFILRFFNVRFRVSLLISLGFLYFYTYLSGAAASTVRAVLMYSVFVLSFLLKRKPDPLNSLGLAGIIILLFDPSALSGVSFQLSFGAVFALIVGFRVIEVKPAKNLAVNYLKQIFFASLCVTLFLTPLVAYYFGRVYLLSVFYNVFLIPFFALILMVNFLLIIFSPFIFVARSLGSVLSLLIQLFLGLIKALGSFRLSSFAANFSFSQVFIYYLILGAAAGFYAVRKTFLTEPAGRPM